MVRSRRGSAPHPETNEPAQVDRIARRALLAAAATGLALSGCARPFGVLARLGGPVPVHIRVLGVPPAQAGRLVAALKVCEQGYRHARRGDITLHVTTALVPDDTWYRCVPSTPTACPSGWYPASPAKRSLPALLAPSRAGQLGVGGVPRFLIRGRTALDVKFGDGALHGPAISSTYQGWPDVILAFDMWQYWLAPLAVDLAEQWKTVTDDRGGLSPHVDRFARYYAAKRGTFLAAFPILRNPMTIYNLDAVQPWDWAHVISALTRPSGHAFNTKAFVPSGLYPQATELAASVLLAFGGGIGRSSPQSTAPAFDTAAASQALTGLAEIVNASVSLSAAPGSTLPYPIGPTYMWTPFGGTQQEHFRISAGVVPLPPGPARRAAPCMYFCATVVSLGRNVRAAADFASFLMNPAAQEALAGWEGALPLRATQAEPVVHARWPPLSAALVGMLSDSGGDLRAADLFGGEKTIENASAYDGVADRFAGALSAVLRRPTGPLGIRTALAHWAEK